MYHVGSLHEKGLGVPKIDQWLSGGIENQPLRDIKEQKNALKN